MRPRARLPVDASYTAATRTFCLFRSALPLARSVYSCFARRCDPYGSLFLLVLTNLFNSHSPSRRAAFPDALDYIPLPIRTHMQLVPFPLQRSPQRTARIIPAYYARSVLTRASFRNSARGAIFPSCSLRACAAPRRLRFVLRAHMPSFVPSRPRAASLVVLLACRPSYPRSCSYAPRSCAATPALSSSVPMRCLSPLSFWLCSPNILFWL
ncbi:hypothetical protein C8J57DRAFT_1322839, partial [Mycena rebaudengoi]